MIRILVLGTAAGGGLPQWNCNCDICRRARGGDIATPRSSQASIAICADEAGAGESWFLINASPDLRQQINDNPPLHPRHGSRHSPIAGVVLTNGDVDAVAGLLNLREGAAFTIYGHEKTLGVLADNSIFNVLDERLVKRQAIAAEQPFTLALADGSPSAIEVVAFDVPGKVPLYLEKGTSADFGKAAGGTLGLHIRNRRNGAHFFFIAACAALTPDLAERVSGAPLVFFDGTLWRDDEMIKAGLSNKTGARMGHMSMAGEAGSIDAFAGLGVGRKVFLHVNNTNPAHWRGSDEHRALAQAGWEILKDGTEIRL